MDLTQLIEIIESAPLEVRRFFYASSQGKKMRAARDFYLLKALHCISADPGWSDCEVMVREIQKFETRIWPNIRKYTQPPERLTDLQKNLFRAFRLEVSVPSSAVSLHNLTKKIA